MFVLIILKTTMEINCLQQPFIKQAATKKESTIKLFWKSVFKGNFSEICSINHRKIHKKFIFGICIAAVRQSAITCLWRRSGVFIVNFEHISHLVLVFLLLTLNM